MILYVNHTRRDAAAATANEVVATVLSLLEEGHLEPAQYARLRIDLDWIQYKQNFREAVMVTHRIARRPARPKLAHGTSYRFPPSFRRIAPPNFAMRIR